MVRTPSVGRSDEPGHDRNDPGRRKRQQHRPGLGAGLLHQRFGRAELIGRDDQLGGVHGLRTPALRHDRIGQERRAEHLARTGDGVEKAGGQLVHHREAETELLETLQPRFERPQQRAMTGRIAGAELVGNALMASEEAVPDLRLPVAVRGQLRRRDQLVRHAAHCRRDNDDLLAVCRGIDRKARRVRDARRIAH